MGERIDAGPAGRPHDERVFCEGEAIFSQADLRELINVIYSDYQYKAAQSAKLAAMINFLAQESNRFIQPELAGQSGKLSGYLNNFMDFLQSNFHPGKPADDGEILFLLNLTETGFETEAFLMEFQLLSLDIEKAYRDYCVAARPPLPD
jgi:hypothetical protein